MSKEYLAHWVIGLLCAIVWFWGDKAGIPAAAVNLAASVVPGLLGHALAYTPTPTPYDPPPTGLSDGGGTSGS